MFLRWPFFSINLAIPTLRQKEAVFNKSYEQNVHCSQCGYDHERQSVCPARFNSQDMWKIRPFLVSMQVKAEPTLDKQNCRIATNAV